MYITSGQKTGAMVGVLLIVGAGAFVYLDPMELDLLGLNPPPAAKPIVTKKASPRPAKAAKNTQTAKQAPVAKPKAKVASTKPDMLKAPSAPSKRESEVSSKKVLKPNVLKLPTPEEITALAKSESSESESTAAMEAPASTMPDYSANTPYPPSVDVRHCLDEATPREIARCAGEI